MDEAESDIVAAQAVAVGPAGESVLHEPCAAEVGGGLAPAAEAERYHHINVALEMAAVKRRVAHAAYEGKAAPEELLAVSV